MRGGVGFRMGEVYRREGLGVKRGSIPKGGAGCEEIWV